MVKGAKSIAEFAIRKWLQSQDIVMGYFCITMNGNEAELKDTSGNTMTLVYDNDEKVVYVK